MFECIPNRKYNDNINELTSVSYVCEYMYSNYLRTFTDVVDSNGLTIIKRIDVVETATILSDVGVVDKKLMSTLLL